MLAGGQGPRAALTAAGLLGFSTVLGVSVMLVFSTQLAVGLPLAAGVCIYVAASDLEGVEAVQVGVAGFVDDSHAAPAEHFVRWYRETVAVVHQELIRQDGPGGIHLELRFDPVVARSTCSHPKPDTR